MAKDLPTPYLCYGRKDEIPVIMLLVGTMMTFVLMLLFFEFGATRVSNVKPKGSPHRAVSKTSAQQRNNPNRSPEKMEKKDNTDKHNHDDSDDNISVDEDTPPITSAHDMDSHIVAVKSDGYDSHDDIVDHGYDATHTQLIVKNAETGAIISEDAASGINQSRLSKVSVHSIDAARAAASQKMRCLKLRKLIRCLMIRPIEWNSSNYVNDFCDKLNPRFRKYVATTIFLVQLIFLVVVFGYDCLRISEAIKYKSSWDDYQCVTRALMVSTNLKTCLCIFCAFWTKVKIFGKAKLHVFAALLIFACILCISLYLPIVVTHLIPGLVYYFWVWWLAIFFIWFLWASWATIIKIADAEIDPVADDIVYVLLVSICILLFVLCVYLIPKFMNHSYGDEGYFQSFGDVMSNGVVSKYYHGGDTEYWWRRIALFI